MGRLIHGFMKTFNFIIILSLIVMCGCDQGSGVSHNSEAIADRYYHQHSEFDRLADLVCSDTALAAVFVDSTEPYGHKNNIEEIYNLMKVTGATSIRKFQRRTDRGVRMLRISLEGSGVWKQPSWSAGLLFQPGKEVGAKTNVHENSIDTITEIHITNSWFEYLERRRPPATAKP